MKIYLISQDENQDYDTYDSAVVYAKDEAEARTINPDGVWNKPWGAWCSSPEQVNVKLIGENKDRKTSGIILASFNAG